MAFGAGSGLMPVHGPHRHPMLLSELGRVELDPRSQLGIEQVHDMPPRSHARHNHVRAPSRSLPGDTSIGTSSLTDVMGLNSAERARTPQHPRAAGDKSAITSLCI